MKPSVNKHTVTACSVFMCAVLYATYLISTTPDNGDVKSESRNLGDAVHVSSIANALYDPLEPLKDELACAYIAGDVDAYGIITALTNAENER